MNKKITDIFFDLDHTLWDFDKNSALAFEKIFKMNEIDVSLHHFLQHYEPINLKYWKLYRDEKIIKENLRVNRLKEAFEAMEVGIEAHIINKLSEDYIANLTTNNHLFEDAIELLEYLKPNYSLHIITNGFGKVQHHKLEKSKIAHYFKTVTNSEMVGVKKPNPKIFHFALDFAKTTVDKSIMIGDNLEADIMGALNIGLDAICFNYHHLKMKPSIKQVKHLNEIKCFFLK